MSIEYSLGLIGYPLGHSLSPILHQAALDSAGMHGKYQTFPIEPSSQKEINLLITQMKKGEFHGFNVTIPFKQTVIPMLDKLTKRAEEIGAVNTIFRDDEGNIIGDNTDILGFWADLNQSLPLSSIKKAIVFGAGGSARAVTYSLLLHGWETAIAARHPDQAKKIKDSFSGISSFDTNKISILELSKLALTSIIQDEVLIVNTTPAGMSPNISEIPWPLGLPFPKSGCLYDLIYSPVETVLVKEARKSGLNACNGLGMLIEQAASAFSIWTGVEASRSAMRNAIPKEYFSLPRSNQ